MDLIVRVNFYKIKNNSVPLPITINPYEQYFDDDVFSDIIFTFDGNSTIKASSIFLATKSPHFKNLLEGTSIKDANKIIINMDGVAYNSFYRLIHYIYTGKLDVNLNFGELLDLYNEANSREIHDLKQILSCRIIDFVDENNLDTLFTLGFTTKNNVLMNAVLKFSAIGHTEIVLDGVIPYSTSSLPDLRDIFEISVVYVVGFEFLNDISCAELNSQNNEILYSYDWIIKNFEDFYQVSPSFIRSDRFYSPVPSYLQHIQGNYLEWRLYINPNDERSADHYNRTAKYISVGKSQRLNSFSTTKYGVSSEISKLIETAKIFSGNHKTIITDLIVRVNFYNIVPLPITINPFEQYFNNDAFSDIIFTFDGNSIIKASSIFLATKSSHFKKLLKDTRKDASKIIINMDGVSYNSFYRLLYYIYTGKLDDNLSFEELLDLYNEANSREIHDLKQILSCRIIDLVDENNLDILFTLGIKTKNNVLKNAFLKFAVMNHIITDSHTNDHITNGSTN
ncbi:9868_t:CDS:2 [Funneliformis caledonium]|uniref:9868_t:CDS:1 n=1 Tax=Funneliformis caledonium TaxID=1117310 RepID=A0A9N9CPH6_9GLOM|nr:9868_t:CDS:2 [Funneliformis caledonium]